MTQARGPRRPIGRDRSRFVMWLLCRLGSGGAATAALPTFGRPVLVAWAAEDRLMPPDHGRRLARAFPGQPARRDRRQLHARPRGPARRARTSDPQLHLRTQLCPGATRGGRSAVGHLVVLMPLATGMIDLSSWPEGSRLILRKERPHPGAQLTFTNVDGHRITAFLTDTSLGVIPYQIAAAVPVREVGRTSRGGNDDRRGPA